MHNQWLKACVVKLVDTQGLKPCPLRVLVQVQAQVQIISLRIGKVTIITLILVCAVVSYLKIFSIFLIPTPASAMTNWSWAVIWSNFSVLHFIFILNFMLVLVRTLINVFHNLLQFVKFFRFPTINLRRFHFLGLVLYLTNT